MQNSPFSNKYRDIRRLLFGKWYALLTPNVQLMLRDLLWSCLKNRDVVIVRYTWKLTDDLCLFVISYSNKTIWHLCFPAYSPRITIYAMRNIMEKQKMSLDGWPVCQPHTPSPRVYSAATDVVTPSATLKYLLGQKVDYFHMCRNNKIWGKLLRVPYRGKWLYFTFLEKIEHPSI